MAARTRPAHARRKPVIIGWTLPAAEREALLRRFAPAYPDVIAHHVTLQFDAPADAALPLALGGEIVGWVNDGAGVEALVLRIDGTTHRPGGGTYHITWSLDRSGGRKPVDSNAVLAERGWTQLGPVAVRLLPARL